MAKHKWSKESYNGNSARHKKSGMIQLRAGIWKLYGIRRALKIGRCSLPLGEEDIKHVKKSKNEKVERETCTYRMGEKSQYT
jgi:hypothetical protein